MADNFCRLCGLGMREEPNAICKSVPHWQAWHEIDLRAAYERGVRDAAACCDDIHTARVAQSRILSLLDKEGGGDDQPKQGVVDGEG